MTDFVHLWEWELSTKPIVFSHMADDISSVRPFQSFNNNIFLHIVHLVLRENRCKALQSPAKDCVHSPLQEYPDKKIISNEHGKWFEPRSNMPWLKKIIWETGALIRTAVDNWRFDSMCRSPLHLDSDDGVCSGFWNVSCQQHSFSGLQSPRWSFSIMVQMNCWENNYIKTPI